MVSTVRCKRQSWRHAISRSRDPGGKFTIFDVLTLVGAVAGAAFGANFGARFGWPLAVVLGLIGFYIGSLPGRFLGDYGIMSLFRQLNAEDTSTLRSKLSEQYYLSHLIVLILLQRGVQRAELEDITLQMLLSENSDVRHHGWRTLNMNFPDTADQLEGLNPFKVSDADREKIIAIRAGLQSPGIED